MSFFIMDLYKSHKCFIHTWHMSLFLMQKKGEHISAYYSVSKVAASNACKWIDIYYRRTSFSWVWWGMVIVLLSDRTPCFLCFFSIQVKVGLLHNWQVALILWYFKVMNTHCLFTLNRVQGWTCGFFPVKVLVITSNISRSNYTRDDSQMLWNIW